MLGTVDQMMTQRLILFHLCYYIIVVFWFVKKKWYGLYLDKKTYLLRFTLPVYTYNSIYIPTG